MVAPEVTQRLIERFVSRPQPDAARHLAQLSARETDVLRLLARGLSNAEIADNLVLGEEAWACLASVDG